MSREIDERSEAIEVLSELLAFIKELKERAECLVDDDTSEFYDSPYFRTKITAYEEIEDWISKRLGD